MSVSQTSVEAYYAPDASQTFATLRSRIAAHILAETKAGRRSYIASIARKMRLDKSTVSGRLNELAKMQEAGHQILIGGNTYRLEFSGFVKDQITGRRSNTFSLILIQQ